MAWFFSRGTAADGGKPKISKPITQRAHLGCEQLESRLLFSANVWLPQQLQPLDGVTGYDQSFQAYHAALGDLMPTVGMSTGVVTLAGSFSLTDTGSYPLSLSATGPYGGSNTFEVNLTGTSLYCLTVLGSVLATGFSAASVVLTQTVSLGWQFVEKDSGGNILLNNSGTDGFTLAGTPGAPFDPFFGVGVNWLGPTWRVSSDNNLNLPSLTFSALTVTETGGTTSYTLQITNGDLAIAGNATSPLYQELDQNGQESYSVAFNQNFGTTTQGNGTFSLSEAGVYSAGSFALSSVAYSENGTSSAALTETTTRTDAGTATGSGLQSSAGNLVTFNSTSAQSYGFTDLSTLAYTETAHVTYGLTQQGTFGSGQFNLSSLTQTGVSTGGFSLTLTQATTQTGTVALTDSQAATGSMGVAGTLSSGGANVQAGQFTLTATDTIAESQSGIVTFSELGAYGAGSWSLGTVSNAQSLSGTFSQQHLETYVSSANGTSTNTDSGNDSYTLNYGSEETTGGAETSTLAETLTFNSVITSTNSYSVGGTVAVTFAETGAVQGGTYSLSSYVLTQNISGTQSTQATSGETDTGFGSATETDASNGSDATADGGASGSDLSGDSEDDTSAFGYTDATTQNSTDTILYAQSNYEAGTDSGGRLALSSVASGDSFSDSWSLSALDSSSATGSQTDTGTQHGLSGATSVFSGQSASALNNATTNFTSTSNYTSTANSTVNQSGFTSWTDSQQGNYAAGSFAFGTTSYQGQGSFTGSAQSAQTQIYAGTNLESTTGNNNQGDTTSLQITSSTGDATSLNSSQQTMVESGTLTLTGTTTTTNGWNLSQQGNFSAGSWSLSSISYQETQAASSASQQTATSQETGTQNFSSIATTVTGATSVYGGTASSQGTFVDTTSGQSSFNETDAATSQQQGSSASTMSQQGSFSGQSYSFPTVTYQEQGSSAGTATAGSTVASYGNSLETTITQSGQAQNTDAGSSQSGVNSVTETTTSNFTTSANTSYQETTTNTDSWTLYQAGNFAGNSLALSSFNSTECLTSQGSYKGADSTVATGATTVTASGAQNMAVNDGAFMSGTYNGAQTVTANFTSSATDSYQGTSQQNSSLVQLGNFSNFSYSFSSVVYQQSDSYTQSYQDAGTSTEIGTATQYLTTNTAAASSSAILGFLHAGYTGGSAETLTSVNAVQQTSSFGDTFGSSGTDTLYQAGSVAAGCYSLSSVNYSQSGIDTWSQSAASSMAEQGQQTQNVIGTYNSTYTVSYTGNNNFGDTVAVGMTVTGADTLTAQNAATLTGGDTWSMTELGSYSGNSYSYASVVYQGVQSESLTQASTQTAQFSGSNAKSASESQLTTALGTIGLINSASSQDTLAITDQDSSTAVQGATDASASNYSWYEAGTYGGSAYTFTAYNQTVSLTDNSTAGSTLTSCETLSIGANASSNSLYSSSATAVANADSSQSTVTGGGTISLQAQNSGTGYFSMQGYVTYTQSEQGSYAAGSFAFTNYSYAGTQTGSYSSNTTQTLLQTLTANGSTTNAATNSASSNVQAYNGSGNTHNGGGMVTITIASSSASGQTTTFNGTISTGDTVVLSQAGTYSIANSQLGSYGGGSFALGSMTYDVNTSLNSSKNEYSGFTAVSFMTVSDQSANTHSGATTSDNSSAASSDSYTRQDTITSHATATSYDNSTYSLYEGGGYGGQSWGLSSFNLLQTDQSASTLNSSSTDASLWSGGFSQSNTAGGVQLDNVSGTFIKSTSITTVVQNNSQGGYTISEQGTFTNAAFGLSGYAFAYAQSSQQTTSVTGGSTETMAGADNAGMSSPTFTGGGAGTVSALDVQSSNSSLSQQGSFAGGSFNLSAVSYAGAASDSYSDSATDASAWTGADSGSASDAGADSGSSAQTVSASGSFVAGSWSLSSYVLAGSEQQANSDSSDQQQSLSLGSFGGTSNSSFASSDASADSSSLYQAGTQAAGAYANASYNYHDGSASTATANAQGPAQGPNLAMGQTWTQQNANAIVLGGTQQQTASATYSYQDPGVSGTVTNNGSAASAAVATTPVVQFGAPDPSVVAAPGVAQLVGTPAGGATAIAQPAAGSTAPGAMAPVPISVNLQVVPATAAWMNTTLQASQQVTNTSTYQQTLNGGQDAAGALDAVVKKATGASFAVTAWNAVAAPALKTAQWIQGGNSIGGSLVALLSLDDPNGEVAASYYRPAQFVSTSNDPLVREVNTMLNNGGQPLTAGSAPLYGTYYDPQIGAAFKVMTIAAGIVVGGIVGGPIGAALAAGALLNEGSLAAVYTLANGPSTSQPMSAQQALSQIGPVLQDGITLAMLPFEALPAGVQPLRGGIPGIGRPGRSLSVCLDAAGRALARRPQDACFSGRMFIEVPGGRKRADELRVGDLVASRSEWDPDGPVEYKEVQEVFVRVAPIVNLHVASGIIETTAEHPFYVPARGWVPAWALQIGDLLSTRDASLVPVEGVAPKGAVETVYNWRIAHYHTYFVGSHECRSSVWAHNTYAVNRNRRSSRAPNHGYVIYDTVTGAPHKFGVSSSPISSTGGSLRAQRQVSALNRSGGRYASEILVHSRNRAGALTWEARTVGAFRDLGHRLPGNTRPIGIPFAGP